MIVCLFTPGDEYEDQRYIEDAAAVVIDPGGFVRVCRDGQQDEDIDTGTFGVCVTP